jgi:hypothetical protein
MKLALLSLLAGGARALVSDEWAFNELMRHSRSVAKTLHAAHPASSAARTLTKVTGATASTACSGTCTTSGGGNYMTQSLTYSTTTGIFTGTVRRASAAP